MYSSLNFMYMGIANVVFGDFGNALKAEFELNFWIQRRLVPIISVSIGRINKHLWRKVSADSLKLHCKKLGMENDVQKFVIRIFLIFYGYEYCNFEFKLKCG